MIRGVKVDGATELRSALRAAAAASPKEITGANRAAAQVVVDRASPPVRSGRLRSNMRATATQRLGQARVGGARVPYAAAIHWGRKRGNVGSPPGNHKGPNPIKGRPFLTDALGRSVPRIIRTYKEAIDAIVSRIKGK